MSEKHYQISPIELVRWAEPLFGFGVGRATGFSEKTIASYEAAAGIRLPDALREYYLACGRASLNCALHEIFIPDKKAKLFKKRLTFSYDHIDEDLETFSKPGEEDYEELAKVRALPRERWGEVTGNYLLFWCENQGCWYAGIKAEDLDQPNPVVYYNDQDDVYSWAPFSDSVQSFLLDILLVNLEPKAQPDEIEDPAEIQTVLSEGGVDFQRLQEPYPFPSGRFCHTCLDTETNTLYVYGEEAEGRSAYLKVFKPDEED